MEIYKIDRDFDVLYVEAVSFPDGIEGAFRKLETILRKMKKESFLVFLTAEKMTILFTKPLLKSPTPANQKNTNYIVSQLETVTTFPKQLQTGAAIQV